MDSTDRGVVYFSLGSVLKPSKMPRETVSFLLSELAKVEQTVLLKWEGDGPSDLPGNIIVRKWFPQNDILSTVTEKFFVFWTLNTINNLKTLFFQTIQIADCSSRTAAFIA